jgi:hypothetical protein
MPAQSEEQRKFLNWKFGHKWVKKHHFDNKGKLPKYKPGTLERARKGLKRAFPD